MAKENIDGIREEELEDNTVEIQVVEKESLWTKTKKKVSAIGDVTLRDVGKGVLKVGGVIVGAGLVIGGAMKLLGNNEDDSMEYYDTEEDFEEAIDSIAKVIEEPEE